MRVTSTQFLAFALAWLATITILVRSLFALVKLILTEWAELHKSVSVSQARIDSLDRQVNGAMTVRIDDGARAAIARDKVGPNEHV